MVTGIVLRAFAYHPYFCRTPEIIQAAQLVLGKIFQSDFYPDRHADHYWTRFTFPFWFTDLISIFDPIAHLGFKPDHPQIKLGLDWFIDQQNKDGGWRLKMLKGDKQKQPYWHNLNICRIFNNFDQN